jgi:(p)ppGpp synthase/HD superfamily hydrolase
MAETEIAGRPLGPRFRDALAMALMLHGEQVRKGTAVPYFSHLLAVTALVLEHGGDEDQAIAALLHDAIEDAGAEVRPLISRFGPRVAAIVEGCTDTDVLPKPPWRERKQAYIDRLPRESDDVILVSMADKLANVRSIIADFRMVGDRVWERFRGGKSGTLWYCSALVDAFAERTQSSLFHELARAVHELEGLAGLGPVH